MKNRFALRALLCLATTAMILSGCSLFGEGPKWGNKRDADKTAAEKPTLAQFFTLWGVRYDAKCLADACQDLKVTVDGKPAPWDTPLARNSHVTVSAQS